MTKSVRPESGIQEPILFMPGLEDAQLALCRQFPIPSKELQSLLKVNQQLCGIVSYIYQINLEKILCAYANKETFLNRIILRISAGYSDPDLLLETVSKIQMSITQELQNSGVRCPNKHLALEDVPRYHQMMEDLNLQRFWGCFRRLLPIPGIPRANTSAQDIRTWMNACPNLLRRFLSLDLSRKGLTSVPREIALFTGLERLNLLGNQIAGLPPGIFNGLGQLEMLCLAENQLSELKPGVFNGLNQLKSLNLNSNQISELKLGIFDGLNQLQQFGVADNQISKLPLGIFDGLNQLKRLGFTKNKISELPLEIFNGLDQLETLDLADNQVRELKLGIFNGLNQLKSLNLNSNQISELKLGIFDGLNQLEQLCFSKNKLSELKLGIFNGLDQLRLAAFYKNKIRELKPGIFNGLNQLQQLGFDHNLISELKPGIFDGLNQLQQLGFDHNLISELEPGIFDGLNQLQLLALANNRLRELPLGTLKGLNQLKRLTLYCNRLTGLPIEMFSGLNQLRELYLHGNPRLLFSFKEVKGVKMSAMKDPTSELNELIAFYEFYAYPCRSLFGTFYKCAASGESLVQLQAYFPLLEPTLKNAISVRVYEEAGSPLTDDLQWGEHHAFDDREIFNTALKTTVKRMFEQGTEEYKNAVYARVRQLAYEHDGYKRQSNPSLLAEDFSDPNWGRDHAQDNILILIDAMDFNVTLG